MKLLQMLPGSPKAWIVAISLLVPIAINYDLLFQMFFAAPLPQLQVQQRRFLRVRRQSQVNQLLTV